jgi:hypothetical protein
MDWGDELVSAWNSHDVELLIARFASECSYTDLPSRMTWEGHNGIRALFEQTVTFHPDFRFERISGFCDGRRYAWEWTTSGTTLGQMLTYRGASFGSIDDQGRIVENHDYWNPKDIPRLEGWGPAT